MSKISIISFLWKHIKPYKWWYLLMIQAPIIGAFYPFIYNYSIKLFIDTIIADFTYADVILPISIFLGANITLDVIWRISQWAEYRGEPYVRRSILLHCYDYVQNHSYRFFQNNFSGSISSKIKGILDGYDKFWAELHHGLSGRILKAIVGIFALFTVNIMLGTFMLIWSSAYFLIMYKLSKRLNKLSFAETESRHAMIGQIADKISNIISIFSFSAKQRELASLDRHIKNDFMPKQIKMYKFDFMVQVVAAIIFFLMYVIILFMLIELKRRNLVTVGDFAFTFGLILMLQEDIWHSVINLQDFSRAMGDFNSSLSIIREPQKNTNIAKEITMKKPSINFKDISFSYDKKTKVFDNLSINITSGEKIGLVGKSGAGKSTLINLLLKYFKTELGQVMIDGQDISTINSDAIRKNIAVIPQDTLLFHRTIKENISYGKEGAGDKEIISASKKAHIHEFIQTLKNGYDTYVGERGIKLSGGQRQRIAIARAILKDAPILILDEATSSLDSKTEKMIQESLNLLIEDKSKTVIAIAHRLSTLKHMDRIIVLDDGKIAEEGNHDELLKQKDSLYKKLWELQEI